MPTFFYETGHAHALNKRVILLTRAAEDIPFDLQHFPHIVYNDRIGVLREHLAARLKWCIDNPVGVLPQVESDLQFVVNGVALNESPDIPTGPLASPGLLRWPISLTIHNRSNRIIPEEAYDVAFVAPAYVKVSTLRESQFGKVR
jgi:hypothetical protein